MNITLVSGSTRGLGLEIAKGLSGQNMKIITAGRSKSALDFHHLNFDSANRSETRKALSSLLGMGLDIDSLVCVVGSGSIRENDPDTQLHRNLETNLICSVILFQEAINIFSNLRNVVFISSIAGGSIMQEPPVEYSVAKTALNAFAKQMAVRYAKRGLLINVVSPGNVIFEGSIWDIKLKEKPVELQNYLNEKVPTNKLVKASSITNFITFLLMLNEDITGQVVCIDGGQSI